MTVLFPALCVSDSQAVLLVLYEVPFRLSWVGAGAAGGFTRKRTDWAGGGGSRRVYQEKDRLGWGMHEKGLLGKAARVPKQQGVVGDGEGGVEAGGASSQGPGMLALKVSPGTSCQPPEAARVLPWG